MESTRKTCRRHTTGGTVAVIWAVLVGVVLALPTSAQRQALSTTNQEARQRYGQGVDRLRARDWPGAADEFTAAIGLDPTFVEAHIHLGQTRMNMKMPTEAAARFEKALALNSDSVEARMGLAFALVELKQHDRAEREARCLLQLDTNRHQVHDLLGQIAISRAALFRDSPDRRVAACEEAVGHFTRAVELAGGNPGYRHALGLALLKAGRLAEAAEHLRRAMQINAKNAARHRELAQVYFRLGRYAEAKAHLILAHRDEKQRTSDLYIRLMRLTYSLGLYPEAAHWAAAAQKMVPEDPHVLLLSGTTYGALGDYTLAEQSIRQALVIDPKLPGAHYELGMLFFDQGQWRAALGSLRKATQNHPNDCRAWYHIGLVYRRLRQHADSDRALARFRELKDAEQVRKEHRGIEAGPPDRLAPANPPPAGAGRP